MPVRPIGQVNKRRLLLDEVAERMAGGPGRDSGTAPRDLSGVWVWGFSRFGGPTTPKVPADVFDG
jgi:hypothetical protein